MGLPGAERRTSRARLRESWARRFSGWGSRTCSACGSGRASRICTSCSSRRVGRCPASSSSTRSTRSGSPLGHALEPRPQLINQFLVELDGVSADNEGILFLAATNAPWHVDDAFRRPGRFDRVVFVPPPDRGTRREIVRIHLEGRLHEQIDLDRIAAVPRSARAPTFVLSWMSLSRRSSPPRCATGSRVRSRPTISWLRRARGSRRPPSGSRRSVITRCTPTRPEATTPSSSTWAGNEPRRRF